jgi:hypothetical protein
MSPPPFLLPWVNLDGLANSYQRCFFEHYAISHLKPFFNYDIERQPIIGGNIINAIKMARH